MKKKNIAIVTGASSGLGKEFVKLLSAKKGLDEIWIISRNEEKLKKIQKRYGEKIVVYPMDLSSLENIKTFGENPSLKNCNIRYLINNAGFAKFCSYDDISIDIDRVQPFTPSFSLIFKAVNRCRDPSRSAHKRLTGEAIDRHDRRVAE